VNSVGCTTSRAWEDDVVAGSGMASWAWGRGLHGRRRHRLRDVGAAGSGEDSTMAWRFRGGLDDGTSSRDVDYGVGSRENFNTKFWQSDGVSESQQG
jgi:hypothetical protein